MVAVTVLLARVGPRVAGGDEDADSGCGRRVERLLVALDVGPRSLKLTAAPAVRYDAGLAVGRDPIDDVTECVGAGRRRLRGVVVDQSGRRRDLVRDPRSRSASATADELVSVAPPSTATLLGATSGRLNCWSKASRSD